MINILIIAFIVILLLILFAGYIFFRASILRQEPKPAVFTNPESPWAKAEPILDKGRKWILSQEHEEWEINSDDNLKLWARFLPAYDDSGKLSKNVVLMMHGYHSFNNNDFAVSAKMVHEAGCSILLPNQRSHDKSEGKYICFGVKERYDCKKWIEEIVHRLGSDTKIILMGVSMGCATVTMTLGLELPDNVKGCISDCGYTSPAEQFRYLLHSSYHLPDFPFMYTQKLFCKLIAGFDIDGCSTIDVLKKQKRPVLFIHGDKDTFVPTKFSLENYDACTAEKELLITEGATHAQSFIIAPDKCWDKVSAFLKKNFK